MLLSLAASLSCWEINILNIFLCITIGCHVYWRLFYFLCKIYPSDSKKQVCFQKLLTDSFIPFRRSCRILIGYAVSISGWEKRVLTIKLAELPTTWFFFSAELVNKQPHTIELACYMKCGMVPNPGFNFSKSPKRKLGELVFEKHNYNRYFQSDSLCMVFLIL